MSNRFQSDLERNYKPSEVLRIFQITQRKLTNWVDKRITIPKKPAQGAGNPSLFNYYNLLEIGVAQALFNMGLPLHLVREIVEVLRRDSHLREWAEDFKEYFSQITRYSNWTIPDFYENESELKKHIQGTKPLGTLIWLPYETQKPLVLISPYDMKRAWVEPACLIPDSDLSEIEGISGFIAVDLGKIRQEIDMSISNLG